MPNFVLVRYTGPLRRGRTTPNARRKMAKYAFFYGGPLRLCAHYMNTSWKELLCVV